jgi:hypothetical protein
MPLNTHTLNSNHHCVVCNSKLVSLIDIEIKQALGEHATIGEEFLKHAFLS